MICDLWVVSSILNKFGTLYLSSVCCSQLVVIAEILEKMGLSHVSKVKGIRLDWGDGSISKVLILQE